MSLEIIALIYFASLVILVIEVFVPSGGVLAVLGIGGLLVSLYFGFDYSAWVGVGQIAIAVTVLPLLFFYALRKMTLNKKLYTQEGFHSEKTELEQLLNKEGVAVTNLRPAGVVLIEGKKVDVVTEGELIDINTPVKVVHVEGTRVVVKTILEGGMRSAEFRNPKSEIRN